MGIEAINFLWSRDDVILKFWQLDYYKLGLLMNKLAAILFASPILLDFGDFGHPHTIKAPHTIGHIGVWSNLLWEYLDQWKTLK